MKASRSQACSIFGISRWNFDTLVKEGLPASKKVGGRGGDWVVDTIEMHEWLVTRSVRAARVAPSAGGPPPCEGGEVLNLEAERARLTKEQADKLERERLQDEKRLMVVDVMRDALIQCFSAVNSRLSSLPIKVAPVVCPEDPYTARCHLERAVEEMRAELRAIDLPGFDAAEALAVH